MFGYLAAIEIEALTATKRNPKPDTQLRFGAGGVCCLTCYLGF